jgi:uncharacterized membrane-anchored protein
MDRSLGLGYALGSLILVACLLTTLAVWYYRVSEGFAERNRDLSVYPIIKKDADWL